MENKLCVITGANSGIGFETAKELSRQGAYVVMVCRNEEKAEAAKYAIQKEVSGAGIDIVLCDFSIQADIRKAAEHINQNYEKIDVLVNNHGFIAKKYTETIDGLEATFGVNHIGYFLFTTLLLHKIIATGRARIVNVASNAHRGGNFDPENLQLKSGFSPMKAYSNSKLFNILFTIELAERLKETEVTVNALHPGVVRSNFGNNGSLLLGLFWKVGAPFMISNKQGAQTSIYLATSPHVEGVNGAYFANSKAVTPRKQARDLEAAKKLWEISEKIISDG